MDESKLPRMPEKVTCQPVPLVGYGLPRFSYIPESWLDNLHHITMPSAPGYAAAWRALPKYMEMVHPLTKDCHTATECVETARVQRRVELSYGIPARHCGMMARNDVISEQSLSELLEEIEGKKEDNMDSLMDRRIKKVVIECEDGSTYEGAITRIEGNPYNLYSTVIEATVRGKVGEHGIKEVIFANPSTIVKWTDGTTTVVTCQDNIQTIEKEVGGEKKKRTKPMPSETYSKEVGLAMCIAKKWAGNQGNYNNIFRKYIDNHTEGEE